MREVKYFSIWQVMNAKNNIEDKYMIIEYLVDGLISEATKEERERVIRLIENMRDGDSCECDNCQMWRKFYRLQSNKRQ